MVNVIGMGYIGLPTALMLAANGVDVVGTDCNESLIMDLRKGMLRFTEKGLDEVFSKAVSNGIRFSTEYMESDQYIVAVPSPYVSQSKKVDTKYIEAAVRRIMKVALNGATIIVESTISPGTVEKIVRPLLIEDKSKTIHLAHAPERIIPGNMVYELVHNPRTIGADDQRTGRLVGDLYRSFCVGDISVTDIKTAEMTKVIENTYRDINIAFANELCKICNEAGVDVYEAIRIANQHPRVNILSPGPGVGGHCIAVDPWFLVGEYPSLTKMIWTARKVNDSMPDYVLNRIHAIMKENRLDDVSRVGLYGLTYKENVNDVRESPTMQLLGSMSRHLATGVQVYDPNICTRLVDNQWMDFEQFLNHIDLVVIMVAHNEIIEKRVKLEGKIVFDTRNCLPSGIGIKMIRL